MPKKSKSGSNTSIGRKKSKENLKNKDDTAEISEVQTDKSLIENTLEERPASEVPEIQRENTMENMEEISIIPSKHKNSQALNELVMLILNKNEDLGNGRVRYEFINGNIYEGEVNDGIMHGKGVYTSFSKTTNFLNKKIFYFPKIMSIHSNQESLMQEIFNSTKSKELEKLRIQMAHSTRDLLLMASDTVKGLWLPKIILLIPVTGKMAKETEQVQPSILMVRNTQETGIKIKDKEMASKFILMVMFTPENGKTIVQMAVEL